MVQFSLQGADGESFVSARVVKAIAQFSIHGTDEVEKQGVEMSAGEELWWNGRLRK
jgi:hypothetical protein